MTDTSEKMQEVYFRRLSEMTPSERLAISLALWTAGDALQRATTRARYPGADENEINYRIAETRYGTELAGKVYRR